jgi:hypothetical protein
MVFTPNSVEQELPLLQQMARLSLIVLMGLLTLIPVGLVLGSFPLFYVGIIGALFGPFFVVGFYGRLHRIYKRAPGFIEIQPDRLIARQNPNYAAPEFPPEFAVRYERVLELVNGVHVRGLERVPSITYVAQLKSRWTVANTRNLPQGFGREHLFLSGDNMESLRAAYQTWRLITKETA